MTILHLIQSNGMCFSTARTAHNAEANLAESSEFLSNADEKKTPRFTDVRWAKDVAVCVCIS